MRGKGEEEGGKEREPSPRAPEQPGPSTGPWRGEGPGPGRVPAARRRPRPPAGRTHVSTGMGVHTTQYGKRPRSASSPAAPPLNCFILASASAITGGRPLRSARSRHFLETAPSFRARLVTRKWERRPAQARVGGRHGRASAPSSGCPGSGWGGGRAGRAPWSPCSVLSEPPASPSGLQNGGGLVHSGGSSKAPPVRYLTPHTSLVRIRHTHLSCCSSRDGDVLGAARSKTLLGRRPSGNKQRTEVWNSVYKWRSGLEK